MSEQPPPGFKGYNEPEFVEIECTFCRTHLYGLTGAEAICQLIDHTCAERDFDEWMTRSLPMKEQLARTIANKGGWRRIEVDESGASA